MSWLRTGGVAVEGLGMLMGRSGREVGKRIMMFKAEELVGVVDMADSVRMSRWAWWTKIESSIFWLDFVVSFTYMYLRYPKTH